MEKKQGSKGLNFLGAFASVVLSIFFVTTAIILPLFYSATGFISPKTITKVVQNIDYVEILENSGKIDDAVAELGVDAQLFDEIMKSKEAGRLIHEFSKELTNELVHPDGSLDNVDSEFTQKIVDKHIDDIIPVIKEKTNTSVDSDKIKQEIRKIIKNSDPQIKEMVSDLRPVKETFTTYGTFSKFLLLSSKWYFILAVCLFEILPLALIYLMRRKNYGGFIWIAVNTGIVGLFVSGAALLVSSGLVKGLGAQASGFVGDVMTLTVGTISAKLTVALIVCFAIMIAAIAACVLFRKNKKTVDTAAVNTAEIAGE